MIIRTLFGILFSILIAGYGLKKRALSNDGAAAGFVVGLFCCVLGGYRGAFVLFTFFISSSKLTRFRSAIKKKVEHEFKKGGQRNATQVFANGAMGCLFAILFAYSATSSWNGLLGFEESPLDTVNSTWPSVFMMGYIAHYACCNGDTWASELGIASNTLQPLLLLGIRPNGSLIIFQRVPRGTNGGVSTVGTLASVAGGLLIGLCFCVVELLLNIFSGGLSLGYLISICCWATFAGFYGSMVDSILGGLCQNSLLEKSSGRILEIKGRVSQLDTTETKHITGLGFLDNHQVNFLASLITSITTAGLYYFLG